MSNYRIAKSTVEYNRETNRWEKINFDEYDLVVVNRGNSYGTATYEVLKNTTDLTDEQIADICDRANFGFSRCGSTFKIYID